jgi:ABC-2 type transport system permease protein
MTVDVVDSRDAAARLVRRRARVAYVVIPAGFGEASRRIFWGDPLRLEVGVDPSQGAAGGMIEGLITAHAYEQVQRVFTDRGVMREHLQLARDTIRSSADVGSLERTLLEGLFDSLERVNEQIMFPDDETTASAPATSAAREPAVGWRPIQIERKTVTRTQPSTVRHPTSSFAICFPQAIVWGVMACAATFAATLITERTGGTLARLAVAPFGRWLVLAGKAGACFATTAVLVVAMLLVARVAFGVRPNSVPLLALAVLCVSVAIVGVMMVFSVLGRTEQAVSGMSWAVIIVMAMLGGGMLPLAFMPPWLQTVSHISLVKWAILALEGAVWRGFSPAEMALPCGVLAVVGAAGFSFGAWMLRWSETR